MKKIYAFIIILLLIPLTLISCSSENNTTAEDISNSDTSSYNDDIQEEEEQVPITFEALNKTYTSSKDLSLIEIGTNIYDDQQSLHYTEGEYKELDFIKDLLYLYLNEDSSIFHYLVSYDSSMEKGYTPITEKDKEKLIKDLNSLRSQMELSSGEEMVVRLDKVTYEGPSSKTNTGSSFKIRVAISRVGATVVPWNYFTITVFQDGNNLLAHLF